VFVTGTVADHFDRRKIAAVAFVGEFIAALALAWYSTTSPTSVTPIFGIVLWFGISRGFASPATRSLLPAVTPPELLPRAIALSSAMWTSAAIVGPILGGFLYTISPKATYLAAAGFIILATIAILNVDKIAAAHAERSERPTIRAAFDGLHFVRRTPLLLAAIGLDLFAVLFGGAVALLPAIAKDKLHVGAVGLGWLRAAGGVGAATMALFLAGRPITRRVGTKLLTAVAVFGAATIVLGFTRSYVIALLAMALATAADMISVFIRGTIVPLATPEIMRGRVFAVEQVFIGASNELGAFESGVAAQALGTTWGVVSGGIATLVIVVIWFVRFPSMRNLDRFDELRHDADA
jgi:hypothetical protein